MENKKYTVEYETVIQHGRDSGYPETQTYVTSDLKSIARTLGKYPAAKVFESSPLNLETVIELTKKGNQMIDEEKKARELEEIDKKMAELEKRKKKLIEGEN